jgi:CheY-like chemotaxis protein
LLEDDFGPKSSGDWDEKVVSSGETITTFTDRKSHDESYVRFTTDGQFTQNEYAYFAKNIDLEEAYARGEFLLISTTSSQLLKNDGDTIYLMQFTNEDGSRVLAGVKREAGINKWILSADGFSKTASGVSSDKWYTIELHYNAFQGTVQMSVDGQETLQINIYSTNQKIKQFDFGIVSATESKDQFIIYADYVKLSTTYTTLEGNTQDTIWTTLLPIISVVSIAIFLAYYRDPIFKIGNNFITNRRKTILIVDNDKTILKTIASFLQENGYTTDTAETGNQAIQKMQTKDYDVGIFSTTLPDISGIELLPKIPRKTTPMYKIVITSVSTKEIGSLAADNGADEYLVKPINPKELIKLIKNHFY